ncbi:hypothetical protein ABC255_09530 [Neobacillus sp. 3P2-tot-E-2]|uniref:hypothetical protein n=1 Tax=Neobacillus sp. 3P2-tot-E-2 TaxID=3132212 RepID=UPI0039A2FF2D
MNATKLKKQTRKNLKELNRQFFLDRLIELGVTETSYGKSVHDLDYEEMRQECILAEMRQVDIEHPEHRWFR